MKKAFPDNLCAAARALLLAFISIVVLVVFAQKVDSNIKSIELTILDFSREDGSFECPVLPRDMTEEDYFIITGLTVEEFSAELAKILEDIESGRTVRDNPLVFSMYGFRCFGGPTTFVQRDNGEKTAGGCMINFIDDGQSSDQWQQLYNSVLEDMNTVFDEMLDKMRTRYISGDGRTKIMIETSSDENGVKHLNWIWLQYEDPYGR